MVRACSVSLLLPIRRRIAGNHNRLKVAPLRGFPIVWAVTRRISCLMRFSSRSPLFFYGGALLDVVQLCLPPSVAACIFLAMAITRNAGTGIHHTVLVLPMPQLLVGSVLGALPWRWLRVGLASLLIGSNLLVVNQYITQFEQNGSSGSFTDATNPLAESLAPTSGENIHFIDWGIREPVDYLLRGRSNLSESFPLLIQATPDPEQRPRLTPWSWTPTPYLWTTCPPSKSSAE